MADTPRWVEVVGNSPKVLWGTFASSLAAIISWAYIQGLVGWLDGALGGISSTLTNVGSWGQDMSFSLVTLPLRGLEAAFQQNAVWVASLPGPLPQVVALLEIFALSLTTMVVVLSAVRWLYG